MQLIKIERVASKIT